MEFVVYNKCLNIWIVVKLSSDLSHFGDSFFYSSNLVYE